jgi:hypothetical protein
MVECAEAIGKIEDRTLPGPAGLLPYRVYTPLAASDGPSGGMIFFHGGAWVLGDRAGSTLLVSRKSRKAYSAALNNQKSCVVGLPETLSPQRYHKPSPGRIGCEECCCHPTPSYLVGVRDHGGRHDRCSSRRHQGKHQSEENEELAHVSLT